MPRKPIKQVSATPWKPTAKKDIVGIMALVVAAVILYFFITGGFGGQATTNQVQQNETAQLALAIPELSNDYTPALPALGSASAQITLIEFGDFECPFSMQFYTETEWKLISEYINTGRVRFYYKDFPRTGLHDKAMLAANAARCADEQGKFWEMHNILYDNQDEWSTLNVFAAKQKLYEYAADSGLNATAFTSCTESSKYQDQINMDIEDGSKLGIISTPAFMVYIPKNMTTIREARSLKTAIKASLFQYQDSYVLLIEGNRDYDVFRVIFGPAERG